MRERERERSGVNGSVCVYWKHAELLRFCVVLAENKNNKPKLFATLPRKRRHSQGFLPNFLGERINKEREREVGLS